jgi:outer membrane immunogenic protein
MKQSSFFSLSLLACVTAIAIGAQPAAAQDESYNSQSMGYGFDWNGPYVGAFGGYGMNNNNDVETSGQVPANVANVAGGARPGSVSLDPEGWLAGGLVGFNVQRQNAVMGIEADLAYTEIEDDTTVTTAPLAGGGALTNSYEQSLDYLATIRARIGYLYNQTLVFATGGFAFGRVDNSVNLTGTAGQTQFSGSRDETEWGYAVGGGVEHAFNNMWTVTASYLYYDLGDDTVNAAVVPGSGGGGTGYNVNFDNDGHILRAGINMKF